jgi:hypothetical protein
MNTRVEQPRAGIEWWRPARRESQDRDPFGAASFGISAVVRVVRIGILSSLTAAGAAAIEVWESLWRPQSLL